MSDTSQSQASDSPNGEAETCSLHRVVRVLTRRWERRARRWEANTDASYTGKLAANQLRDAIAELRAEIGKHSN